MDNLPEDIIIIIYNKLCLSDIYNFNYVNNRFYNIFKKNKIYIKKNCDKYTDIDTFYNEDYNLIYNKLYKLEYINELCFKNCDMNNINFLENIEINYLNIYKCFNLSLLPQFKNLYKISIDDCASITNSSLDNDCLLNVRIINLTRCYKITDISILSKNKKLYSLNISDCININSDITKFDKLEKLNIAGCNKLDYSDNTIKYLNKIKFLIIDCIFEKEYKNKLNNYKVEHGGNISYYKKYCFSCNNRI